MLGTPIWPDMPVPGPRLNYPSATPGIYAQGVNHLAVIIRRNKIDVLGCLGSLSHKSQNTGVNLTDLLLVSLILSQLLLVKKEIKFNGKKEKIIKLTAQVTTKL